MLAGDLDGPLRAPARRCRSDALGLVDRRHEIVTFGAEQRRGEVADTAPVGGDGLGGGAQLGGGRADVTATHAANVRTPPVTSPTVADAPDPVPVRADLRALEGYHSAQVDVDVRLNTNESPLPAARRRGATSWPRELASIEWHRYPDRAATDLRAAIAGWHGVRPEQVFAANGSNEVLQTLLLTYAGPGRTVRHVRADVPAARPHRPDHRRHRRRGRAAAPTSRSTPTTRRRRRRATPRRPSRSCARRTTRPASSRTRRSCARVLDAAPGLVVVDEAYAQFADWSALDLVARRRPLAVVRTFSKTWSMAAARLGYLVGPIVARRRPGEGRAAVPPRRRQADRRTAGAAATSTRWTRGSSRSSPSASGSSTASPRCPSTPFPSGANFVLFRPRRADGHEVWQGLVDRGVLVRDCSRWPRLDGCLRVTIGTPAENDRFLAALGTVLA